MLKIQTFPLPPLETNAYLVTDTESSKAILVDAPQGAWSKVGPALERHGSTLEACVLTHAHFDHVLGAHELNRQGVPLYLHEDDRGMLEGLPGQLKYFGMPGEAADITIDHWLTIPASLHLLDRDLEIRHVPGHCPGSVLIYSAGDQFAFVGDAIFAGGVGRTDFPGCSFEQLENSIREQIYTLPDNTTLYPGHGPATTVGREKKSNPYVRA